MVEASKGDSNFNHKVLDFILQSHLIGMKSAYSHWLGSAEVYSRYYPEILRSLCAASYDPGADEEVRRKLLNCFNGYVREMLELSTKEVSRFQAELAEALAKVQPTGGPEEAGQYWRRWNVKP